MHQESTNRHISLMPKDKAPATQPPKTDFPTTSWQLVQNLASSDPAAASAAFGSLAEQYRYPIYAFIRSELKCSHQDAEDHLQGFFIHLLRHSDDLSRADAELGRLRSYMLGILRHYLSSRWRKDTAAKRDVRQTHLWDSLDPEERYRHEAAQFIEPCHLFDREWARSLIESAIEKARAAWGLRLPSFDELLPYLSLADPLEEDQVQRIATRHRKTVEAVRMSLSRLRKHWRQELLSLIKATLESPTDKAAKTELEYLLSKI
ncbi:MAG: hypothetical protein IPK32_04045 [Verrucomicrobiaceae bacterium]|nr:hypothetical protein [Verrucomicrobiaceae bacterium]